MGYKSSSFPINQWPEDDKPREKLINKGKLTLSNAELIAILIGSGSKDESAVSLSKTILREVGNNLNELGKYDVNDLIQFKGIGKAKAVAIIAALELGRRRRGEKALVKEKISSSKSVYELMHPILGDLPHEEFWIIYLNNSNKVIHQNQISKGGITGTLVDIRIVLKTALQINAVALILVHNHPSGTLKPSEADKSITEKLKLAAASMDIKVLDHLIVTDNYYYSFADEGIL